MPQRPVFPLALAHNPPELPYLSLGMVNAYLKVYRERKLCDHYQFHPLTPAGPAEFPLEEALASVLHCSEAPIVLLSSYVWNLTLNLDTAKRIKAHHPDALIVMGGPEVPRFTGKTEQFLDAYPQIDVAVLGEGEMTCAELLDIAANEETDGPSAFQQVAGIVFRLDGKPYRTTARNREKDLASFPSPYLTGEFEPWFRKLPMGFLESNRGCPFGCTYCDWGSATLQKVTKFELERVTAEINYIAANKIDSVFLADANFGMLEQDIAIAEAFVSARQNTGYPRRLLTNFAKNGGRRFMRVIKILHEGGLLSSGIISLQTTDETTLKAIRRDNIKTSAYEDLMKYFAAEGIPMSTDLMIGLPGQTQTSVIEDLQFCFDWKVSANGNFVSMMPNAPMAEDAYVSEFNLKTDPQNIIQSSSTISQAQLEFVTRFYMTYQFFVRLGVLKYVLYFLQVDKGLKAMEVISRWLSTCAAAETQYPFSADLYAKLLSKRPSHKDWALIRWGKEMDPFFTEIKNFYTEFFDFVRDSYQVQLSANEISTLITTQEAVMPAVGRSYPQKWQLQHDFTNYFLQLRKATSLRDESLSVQPLCSFAEGHIEADAGERIITNYHHVQLDGHSDHWEVPSNL